MRIDYTVNKTIGAFVCNRGTCRARPHIYRSMGTWFENIKLDLSHVFYLMYCFGHYWPYDKVIWEDILRNENETCLSTRTIADWYNYCRETVVIYQFDKQTLWEKLVAPGKIVQIDVSLDSGSTIKVIE